MVVQFHGSSPANVRKVQVLKCVKILVRGDALVCGWIGGLIFRAGPNEYSEKKESKGY